MPTARGLVETHIRQPWSLHIITTKVGQLEDLLCANIIL